jgi:hypothetical protein
VTRTQVGGLHKLSTGGIGEVTLTTVDSARSGPELMLKYEIDGDRAAAKANQGLRAAGVKTTPKRAERSEVLTPVSTGID